MRDSGAVGRMLAAVVGGLLVLAGLATLAISPTAVATGVWLVVVGLVLIVATIVERRRYRSETADRESLPIGPGGGEPLGKPLEGRFQRTDEVFIDPTSSRRMRVWLDGTSGERRYRAED
jgi:hypothetical protein